MLILNDLWQGELCPSDSFIKDEAEYRKARNVFAELEKRVLNSVPKESSEEIEALIEAHEVIADIAERDAFTEGVRFGVCFMLDALSS